MATGLADQLPPLRATSAVEPSDQNEFTAWSERRTPAMAPVAEDVWVIPVPAATLPIRYTLCYVVRRRGGHVVIDPGYPSVDAWRVLTEGLAKIGVEPGSLRGIVATHVHPDHSGLVERLRLHTGAWFAMGADEPLPPTEQSESLGAADDLLLQAWGVPAATRDALNIYRANEAVQIATTPPDRMLHDGDVLDDVPLRVISTPGHTPGHICLATLDGSVLFTGDHVLPRISPHTSVWVDGLPDPIRAYRKSLESLQVEPDVRVCPGHEYRFVGIEVRARELRDGLDRRSEEILGILRDSAPDDVWKLASLVSWSRGWESLAGMNRRLAVSECAGHVEYLAGLGELPYAIATRAP